MTLDINYDRLEHVANYDSLVRDLLGLTTYGGQTRRYPYQTLLDNVKLLDESLLAKINELVVRAGHQLVKKKTTTKGFGSKLIPAIRDCKEQCSLSHRCEPALGCGTQMP